MLLFLGWRILKPIAKLLPRKWSYKAAHILTTAVFWIWPTGRAAMYQNLKFVLKSDDVRLLRRTSRRQLNRYGEYLVDALLIDQTTPQQCYEAMPTKVWPKLGALAQKSPILFALMHFGNWDAGGGAYSYAVGPSHVLVESLGHPSLDKFIQNGRDKLGMQTVNIRDGILIARRALAQQGTLAVLFDRPVPKSDPGVDVLFFGQKCRIPDGFARIALASQARVIPLAIARKNPKEFRFSVLIDLDFQYQQSNDKVNDITLLTQNVLNTYENWVRLHPDQWYQFRPFFLESQKI